MSKIKIVLVTSRFPFPLEGGFEMKNFHLIEYLSRHFDISAHFILTKFPLENDVNRLKKFCKVHIHKTSFMSSILNIVFNFFQNKPLQNAFFTSSSAKHLINADLNNSDVAICSVIRTADYIIDFKGPKIFDLADSKGFIYKNNISTSKGLYKLIFWLEANRMLLLERLILLKGGTILLFNKFEAQFLGSSSNIHVVPHGVNNNAFKSKVFYKKYSDGLTFIGKLNVPHNVEMIIWFVDNVLPWLSNEIKLYIIGSSPSKKILDIVNSSPKIHLLGFVDDPGSILFSSIASICPLQSGGGIQNKIIDSMASGAVTLANSKAASQFHPITDSGIIECNSPDDWIFHIEAIYKSPQKYQCNRELGIDFAKNNFSWEAYGVCVRSIIQNLVGIDSK